MAPRPTSRARRGLAVATAVAVAVTTLAALTPSPAQAGQEAAPRASAPTGAPPAAPAGPAARVTYKTLRKNVGGAATQYLGDFGVCLDVRYAAKMSARSYFANKQNVLDRPKFDAMTLDVTTKQSCAPGAPLKKRNTFDTIEYASYLYGYKCSFDPSFSLGLPWAISVGVTPDCGDERVAKLGDSQKGTRRAYAFKKTTLVDVAWDDKDSYRGCPPNCDGSMFNQLCTSVSAYVTVRRTQGATRPAIAVKLPLGKACIRD